MLIRSMEKTEARKEDEQGEYFNFRAEGLSFEQTISGRRAFHTNGSAVQRPCGERSLALGKPSRGQYGWNRVR